MKRMLCLILSFLLLCACAAEPPPEEAPPALPKVEAEPAEIPASEPERPEETITPPPSPAREITHTCAPISGERWVTPVYIPSNLVTYFYERLSWETSEQLQDGLVADLEANRVDRALTEAEIAALPAEIREDSAAVSAGFRTADVDNDGSEELLVCCQEGFRWMSPARTEIYKRDAAGGCVLRDTLYSIASADYRVYDWHGRHYLILLFWDRAGLRVGEEYREIDELCGLSITELRDGRVQEEFCLGFDPAACWVEQYDGNGRLTGLLPGAPNTRNIRQEVSTQPPIETAPPDVEPPSVELDWDHLPAVEAPTYIPQTLVDTVRQWLGTLTDGEVADTLAPLAVERRLRDEEAAALPGYVLDTNAYGHEARYFAVDFDNDGVEDLYAQCRDGMGAMAMWRQRYYRGIGGGDYQLAYVSFGLYPASYFISWEGRTYQVSIYDDICDQPIDNDPDYGFVRLFAMCYVQITSFAGGWPRETVSFGYYPTDIWTERRDGGGTLLAMLPGPPEARQWEMSIRTLGVNTDFALPKY